MMLLTSKSTVCPWATAPMVASTGPSISGWVLQVTVRSFHPQSEIGWRRPPATLCALVTRHLTCADAAHADPEERPLHAGGSGIRGRPVVDGEERLRPEVGGRQIRLDVRVRRDGRDRRAR